MDSLKYTLTKLDKGILEVVGNENENNLYDSTLTYDNSITLNMLISVNSKEEESFIDYAYSQHSTTDTAQLLFLQDGLYKYVRIIMPTEDFLPNIIGYDVDAALNDFYGENTHYPYGGTAPYTPLTGYIYLDKETPCLLYYDLSSTGSIVRYELELDLTQYVTYDTGKYAAYYIYTSTGIKDLVANKMVSTSDVYAATDSNVVKEEIYIFSDNNLENCYYNLCKEFFKNWCNECEISKINSFNRDLVHMAIHCIHYCLHELNFFEAQRLLERISICSGPCSYINANKTSSCGCRK